MPRIVKSDRGNYTNTSNILVRDHRLSWKARGIFNYLWSQSDKWQFHVKEVAAHSDKDGVKSLRSGLDELEKFGYLKRVNRHNKSGSFDGMDWLLSDAHGFESASDQQSDRRDHFGDDAVMAQKQPKKCHSRSDALGVQPQIGSTSNGTLRNNNSKNYQLEELSSRREQVKRMKPAPPKSNSVDPDKVRHKYEKAEMTRQVNDVLRYLNQKIAPKTYSLTAASNRKFIRGRLKDGFTVQQCKIVIDKKYQDWHHVQFKSGAYGDDYLTPVTLFRPRNFERYLNETPKAEVKRQEAEQDDNDFANLIQQAGNARPNDDFSY